MDTYYALGLMSGTSLDGLDIAHCRLTYKNENWIYDILNSTTIEYDGYWIDSLRGAESLPAQALIALDHDFGKFLGEQSNTFIRHNNLKVDFIASHGHTVFHQPSQHISLQIGNGAYLAAYSMLPVICDFRTTDIALGGQGAPLVPIGDELLFSDYDFCLNLGGISNVSFNQSGKRIAFDVGACNMLLNTLANEAGLSYDNKGNLARSGSINEKLLQELNAPTYFSDPYPKSLGKEWVLEHSLKSLSNNSSLPLEDRLHTTCHHIAYQIKQALPLLSDKKHRILTTGGGAFNSFLMELLQYYLGEAFSVEIPEPEIISFKEALVFAFLGTLRWRGEHNSLGSVTGACRNSIGGAIYLG